MDETAIQRVVNFSTYLKSSADILLDKCGVVSLDTWTLYEIEEAFSLIFEVEKYTNFHVLPPNNRQHPAIPHIQFLYDILQKVKKLKILTKPNQVLPQEQQVNLKCFRNLFSLELDFIPVHQLKGLQNLRPVLKYLTVRGVCSQLSEILLRCGADKSTEYAWENLQFANFSRNQLNYLDSSLRLLPAIKILNLSYCQLRDASAIFCLPTISNLDLSYNKLALIPTLSGNASNSLVSLNLSNNMIVDLKGIERFSNLEELNLKENFISIEETLFRLSDLPNLRYLNLLRNPITYGLNYRIHAFHCLNPATKFCEEFLFDECRLVFSERKEIGATAQLVPSDSSSSQLIKFLTEKVSNLLRPSAVEGQRLSIGIETSPDNQSALIHTEPEPRLTMSKSCCYRSNPKVPERKKSRKNQTRHISITDPDDSFQHSFSRLGSSFTYSVTNSSSPKEESPSTIMAASKFNSIQPHTQSYLQQDSDFGILTTAPSQSDKLLEEILTSHAVLDRSEESIDATATNNDHSQADGSVTQETSIVSSATSSFCRMNESELLSRRVSQDCSPIHTDDDELEPHRELYSVVAKWEHKLNDKSVELESDFVFLSFTQYFYKEKNGLSGATMVKLNITSLQGMEVLATQPYKVALHFNHTHPDLCSRIFILEEEDYKLMKELVDPIIERNHDDDDTMPTPPPCKKCGLPFYGMLACYSGNNGKNNFCKYCGNKKKSSSNSNSELNGKTNLSNASCVNSTTKLFGTSDVPEPKQSLVCPSRERKHARQKSSAQSSDSSESASVCSSDVSAGHLRQGSDVDRLSNPSMSSIEVLSEKQGADLDERGIISEKWVLELELPVSAAVNSDARTPPDYFESDERQMGDGAKEEVVTPSKEPALMQESSSSGSMTGSVCTAVDRLSSGQSTPLKGKKERAKETVSGSRERLDVANTFPTSNNTGSSVPIEDITCLSTSAKSTDTICHQPITSLREAFVTLSENDSDTKGIVLEDPSKRVSLEPWAKNLLDCYTSYSWEWWEEIYEDAMEDLSNRESNPIVFSFDDFSVVDHRLKLFCEVFLFTEQHETLQGLVKAIATVDSGKPFSSLFVISNRKVYILRIRGHENDVPQDWLDVEISCFLEEVPTIYTLFQKQGIVLHLKEKFVLICLADTQRTNAVLSFVLECFERFNVHPQMDDSGSRLQSESLRRQVSQEKMSDSEVTIHLFQMVTLLHEKGQCTNHFLVITASRVILLEADLSWLVSSASQEIKSSDDITVTSPDLVTTCCNALDDVTQIDVFSDMHLKLEFYQQRSSVPKPPWNLHLASPWAACNLIQTFRPLWIDLLKIDLDIVCYSEDLYVIKDILKETPFSDYIK